MGKYASIVPDHTNQLEEAKLWRGKESRIEALRLGSQTKEEAMLCIDLHSLKNGVFNFVYYDSNDELRVDDEAILRMNPNSRNSEIWQGASYFFKWKKEESDGLCLLVSARKGFGKEFRSVKYTWEYEDRDRLPWKEAMQELNRQTADRKAAEKEWAKKVKKEEVSIAKFLSQRENEILEEKRQAVMDEQRAKMAKTATEVRRTLRTLNEEAAADAKEGGTGMGKKPKYWSRRVLGREEILIDEKKPLEQIRVLREEGEDIVPSRTKIEEDESFSHTECPLIQFDYKHGLLI
ncbi:hypothetical protein BCON_0270g00040 [Botryotinia convoluta]|uniref:Uncharacterized protein n=1 Tax=Botryotinia convoluta TaxID=54673 RepID=A0A4Z1HRU0_9HELO|nr:hypothetical protein BCON_0270g00040 [Botryotinia convoluta]